MSGSLEGPERLDQAALRRLEVALRLEELRTTGPAEGDQRSVEMAGKVGLDHLVPFEEPLQFARFLAREGHDAADVAEDDGLSDLSAGDGDHRLVERRDPGIELPREEHGPTEERERGGLQVGVVTRPADLEGSLGMRPHRVRVHGESAAREGEPAVYRPRLRIAE